MKHTLTAEAVHTALTLAQETAWSRRGYLILHGLLSPADILGLTEAAAPPGSLSLDAREGLIDRLQSPVQQLLGGNAVLLALEASPPEGFGLDAMNPAGAMSAGLSVVLPLSPRWRENWDLRFLPGSHLIAPDIERPCPGVAMQRLAEAVRSRGLEQQSLEARPGDALLRHPRLLRGAIRRTRTGSSGDWIRAQFTLAQMVTKARRKGQGTDRVETPANQSCADATGAWEPSCRVDPGMNQPAGG
jgi:hypothetical protein